MLYAGQPKKYPYPLPPQSARFHDMFRVSKPEPMPSVPSPTLIPLGPRDGGMIQRSAIANNNVPSGPRFQPQPQSVRDANHPDFAHAPRVPPSGPSATISSRVRLPRTSNEMVFTPNESPAVRDRDTMDVDSLPPSRAPPLRTNDITIRAGSGMYADREQPADALPKAPRAMASKVSVTNTSLPPAISPSTPTTPFSTQRSASGQEFVPDKRERSPPPHIGRNDRWEPRGPPERYSRPVNTIARQDPVWRSDPLRDDARTSPAHKDMEISQARHFPFPFA